MKARSSLPSPARGAGRQAGNDKSGETASPRREPVAELAAAWVTANGAAPFGAQPTGQRTQGEHQMGLFAGSTRAAANSATGSLEV